MLVGAKKLCGIHSSGQIAFRRVLDPCIVCDIGLHMVVKAQFVLDTIGIEMVLN